METQTVKKEQVQIIRCKHCNEIYQIAALPYCFTSKETIKDVKNAIADGDIVEVIDWDPDVVNLVYKPCHQPLTSTYRKGDVVTDAGDGKKGEVIRSTSKSVWVKYEKCKVQYKDIQIPEFFKSLIPAERPKLKLVDNEDDDKSPF